MNLLQRAQLDTARDCLVTKVRNAFFNGKKQKWTVTVLIDGLRCVAQRLRGQNERKLVASLPDVQLHRP